MRNRLFSLSLSQTAVASALLLALVGCSSPVKLEEVPVADAKVNPAADAANAANANANGANGTGVNSRNVQAVQVDPNQAAKELAAKLRQPVYFDYDSFVVQPQYAATVETHAAYLKADAKRRVSLEGHTDERGGREYNLALGQKRAEAVRRALSLLGVSDAQVEAVSFGEEKPAMTGQDEGAYAKNRRVEFSYR